MIRGLPPWDKQQGCGAFKIHGINEGLLCVAYPGSLLSTWPLYCLAA